MSSKGKDDLEENTMGDSLVNGRGSLGSRTLSGSFTKSRKNSRIATVKPVTKCLSSSEEDVTKATKITQKDASSPRIAKLLSKDMSSLDKDSIVAELEKCLSELEQNENPYASLTDEYKRMEEERDELAKELENAFGDLEGYMHHVREVESERKSIEADRDELAKEVENLKYCLTHRQEVEENSLKLGKEAVEAQLKDVNAENERMKEQINELLDERQSLIESLLNLHSREVDDVIQTRSRSCSVVSTDSASSSSLLRGECMELRDRVQEAEEAEMKVTQELAKCKEYLQESLQEKLSLEKKIKELDEELSKVEAENDQLNDELDDKNDTVMENIKAKDDTIEKLRKEVTILQNELASTDAKNERMAKGRISEESKLQKLEEENSRLRTELDESEAECARYREREMTSEKEHSLFKDRATNDLVATENENKELKEKVLELEDQVSGVEELQKELLSSRKEKSVIEKQMADIGEKLLNERALGRKQKADMQMEIDQLTDELADERNKMESKHDEAVKVNEMTKQAEDLKIEKRKLEIEMRSLKKVVEKNKEELGNRVEEKERELSDKEQRIIELADVVDDLRKELEETTAGKEAFESRKCEAEAKISRIKEEFGKERKALSSKLNSLEQAKEKLQSKVKDLVSELNVIKNELLKEKGLRENTEKEKDNFEKELKELRGTFAESKKKLELELKSLRNSERLLNDQVKASAGNEEKLRQSNYSIRELEQSLSDAVKEKKDFENEALSRFEEAKKHHESERQKLAGEISELQKRLFSDGNGEKHALKLKSKLEDMNIFIERAETKVKELEGELKYTKKQASDSENVVSTLRKEKSALQLEIGSLRSELAAVRGDFDKVTRQLRNACADLEKAIGEKKLLKEQLEYSKFELENSSTLQKLSKESEETLLSEKVNSHLQKHEELRNDLQLEIERLKEEQKMIENDLGVTKMHLEQAQDKELKFMHSINGLSENIERLRRDKSNLEKALESAKTENSEMSGKIRKMSQLQNTQGQEASMKSFSEENEALRQKCNLLEDDLAKAYANNKTMLDKVRSTEETNANALRSLKARKTELQLQLANVQHEKEDLEKEVKVLKESLARRQDDIADKEAKSVNGEEAVTKLQAQVEQVKEELSECQSKVTRLDDENHGYKEKLQESEELILDLQKAVARANDVAMEKALEVSRQKRLFEKKYEKLLKENFSYRKQLYFDASNLTESGKNYHDRSFSELAWQTRGNADNLVETPENDGSRHSNNLGQQKKSVGELHRIVVHDIEKGVSLSRSGSAPVTQRELELKPVKTKITAGSVTPPVKYFSDTDSVGSKPDSSDGDNAPPSPRLQKSSPPMYDETSRESALKDQDVKRIPQPNKIHRPIKLKEIKFPSLSPAPERRAVDVHAQNRRSPVMRSPAMRSPGRRSPALVEKEKPKHPAGKERMEHWV